MLAIGITEYGGPSALQQVALADPHAGPDQVRIRVRAAAVAPVDAMLRTGLLAEMNHGATGPFVPGMEVAGVIDEVGDDVDPSFGLRIGLPVVGFVDNRGSFGGYSDYVALPAASVVAAPRGSTPEESASFVNNALTALNALEALALPAGSTLLVSGAAGSVGGYLTQLAAHLGLRVIGVAAAADELLVRSFGAEFFVSRGTDALEHVRGLMPRGVDAAADAALLGEPVLGAIRRGGQLARFRFGPFTTEREIVVHQLNVRERATDRAAIGYLRDLVEQDILSTRVGPVFPAAQAVKAHQRLEAGGTRGRIILRFPVTT